MKTDTPTQGKCLTIVGAECRYFASPVGLLKQARGPSRHQSSCERHRVTTYSAACPAPLLKLLRFTMADHGITFAALLLALAALTHAADAAHKNDARLLFDDADKSVTMGAESLFFIGAIFVGLLLVSSFLGLFGTTAKVAQPYDYASTAGYGAPTYDDKTTFIQQLIEDAVNKFL
nr:uncharacterized protein LOC113817320 [Penaeus vannamei]